MFLFYSILAHQSVGDNGTTLSYETLLKDSFVSECVHYMSFSIKTLTLTLTD